MEKYKCNACGLRPCEKERLIAHSRSAHPDCPEVLMDAIGETWDPAITRLIKEKEQAIREGSKHHGELTELRIKYHALVTRWNAMILIMRSQ